MESYIIENIIIASRYLFLIPLYSVTTLEMQEKIKNTINNYLTKDDKFNFHLYSDSVIKEIISPSIESEDKMLLELSRIWNETPTPYEKFPDSKEQILNYCMSLYLNNKLLNLDKFSIYFKNSGNKNQFLYDMDNFDYSNFKLDWIDEFNDNLKKLISENQVAYTKIKSIFKEVLAKGEYDKDMLNDYFKYFDK